VRSLYVLVASFLLAPLLACGERIAFALPSTATATVTVTVTVHDIGTGSKRSIQPNTDLHQTLSLWVARNQDGWQPYVATPPAQGIIVRAEELDVQFIGERVLLHSRQGIFTKKVTPSEYAFLSS
jgi:hypothetical protein